MAGTAPAPLVRRLPVTGPVHGPTPAASAERVRSVSAPGPLLLQVALVSVPSAVLLGTGRPVAAAGLMWGTLLFFLAIAAVRGRSEDCIVLLLGSAPIVNLLRTGMFHAGPPMVFAAALALLAVSKQKVLRQITRRCTPAVVLVGMALVYYSYSVLYTQSPRANMRIFEMACAALAVQFLAFRPRLLQRTLMGVLLSSWAVAFASYAHIGTRPEMRLGAMTVDDMLLGNPFALGVSLGLVTLALFVDRGWWVGLQANGRARVLLLLLTIAMLAMTASRAGWLFVASGALVAVALQKKLRGGQIALMTAGIVAVILVARTPVGEPFLRGWERTFGEGRTLSQATSGRFDQWYVTAYALTDSPRAFLLGHGPRSGPKVYARFSLAAPTVEGVLERKVGAELDLHALLLHIAVEIGMVGLVPFCVWLAVVGRRVLAEAGKRQGALPAACLVSFFGATLTASGFDAISGFALGIALLGAWKMPAGQRRAEKALPDRRLMGAHRDGATASGGLMLAPAERGCE